MSDTATATPAVATRGRPKTAKPKKKKNTPNHPNYMEMSISAINEIKDRNGLSRQAILKYIMENYEVSKDTKLVNTHLKIALKRGLSTGVLKHAKGQGASGSFRISDKEGPVMRIPRKSSLKTSAPPPAEKVKIIERVETPKKKIGKRKKAKSPIAKKSTIAKSPKKVVAKKKTVAAKAKKPKSPKRSVLKKSAAKPRKLKSSKRGKK